MGFFQQIIAALPAVATSWQAVVGYVAVVIAFVVVSLKVTRNKNLLNRLQSLPARDRAHVLQMEMGAAYLAAGLSPEQWLQKQRQQYYFFAFLAVCILVLALVVAARLASAGPNPVDEEVRKRTAAREVAQRFVAVVHARDFNSAYEMFPDQIKQNTTFAQFRADLIRTMSQLPMNPLKHTVEQVVDNGGYLSILFFSEFSVDTRIRDIVTFTKADTDWKLWGYSWQPVEWPLVWPASTEIQPSAAAVMKSYKALSQQERSAPLPDRFRGNITGAAPGWKLVVDSIVSQQQDEHRCGVRTVEPVGGDASVFVELKRVIGGCQLKTGQRLLVQAILSGVSDSQVELDGVRYVQAN
jgi:hypothetical protein